MQFKMMQPPHMGSSWPSLYSMPSKSRQIPSEQSSSKASKSLLSMNWIAPDASGFMQEAADVLNLSPLRMLMLLLIGVVVVGVFVDVVVVVVVLGNCRFVKPFPTVDVVVDWFCCCSFCCSCC